MFLKIGHRGAKAYANSKDEDQVLNLNIDRTENEQTGDIKNKDLPP